MAGTPNARANASLMPETSSGGEDTEHAVDDPFLNGQYVRDANGAGMLQTYRTPVLKDGRRVRAAGRP